jgi:hypothetical protein
MAANFECFMPALATDRNQNSTILLRRGWLAAVEEVTAQIVDSAAARGEAHAIACADGDLFAIVGTSREEATIGGAREMTTTDWLLVSFHGDSNGLATPGVVAAIDAFAAARCPAHRLVVGLDANAWNSPKESSGAFFISSVLCSRILFVCSSFFSFLFVCSSFFSFLCSSIFFEA